MEESGVNIKYEPFKEVIVMQRNFFSTPEEIARFAWIISGGKTAGLYWTEGVAFVYFPLPASTETAARTLVENGRVYWTFLGYTHMPSYQQIIETKEKMMVPVIDMSLSPLLTKVAKWLKKQK